ncbi:MAG TPA: DNA-3-methyladenine glycosylase I [Solirubrobacteraceae bacterium]|nr:DNA-3-methyladenine glycosylase I [Solirubrobacteraceae bacterium]
MADPRCFGDGDAPTERYHDDEWGRPERDETRLFEALSLEGLQSGLAWRTILHRRDGIREAFHGFDPERVARMGRRDVDRLMHDARVIRHRPKLEAIAGNGRATLALRDGETLPALVWRHQPGPRPAPRTWDDVATAPEARALAKELKRHGFAFVGPTTVYALMQAAGLVNDHLASCPARRAVEALA